MSCKLLGLTAAKIVCSLGANVNSADTDVSMQVWLCEKKICFIFYEVIL